MEIKLEFSPECDVKVEQDAAGNVRALTLTPYFSSPKARAVLLHGRTTSDQKEELERFSIGVGAADGSLDKRTFAKHKAAADMTKEERDKLKSTTKTKTDETANKSAK